MATAKLTSEDPEKMSAVMAAARKQNDRYMKEYEDRADEIDKLENEIINEYTNSEDIKLASTPDHINIQVVLSATQRHLSRVTEIYAGALKNITKLKAVQTMLLNALLPLMSGTSSEIRNAKANECTQGINYLIELEEGLISICELATKNLKTAQETASRTLKAFELDLTYFDGASSYAVIVAHNKKEFLNGK